MQVSIGAKFKKKETFDNHGTVKQSMRVYTRWGIQLHLLLIILRILKNARIEFVILGSSVNVSAYDTKLNAHGFDFREEALWAPHQDMTQQFSLAIILVVDYTCESFVVRQLTLHWKCPGILLMEPSRLFNSMPINERSFLLFTCWSTVYVLTSWCPNSL